MEVRLPDFLVVGAAKCGTTSLDSYLRQHPEVLLPRGIKETNFFCWDSIKNTTDRRSISRSIKTLKEYRALFQRPPERVKAVGEVCVSYLYFHERSIRNIKRILGDPRIIIVLRNPVARAYSAYLHRIRLGYDTEPFEVAMKLEKERRAANRWWGYQLTGAGFYSESVKAYQDSFSRVKVFLFDDLKEDSTRFM